MTNPAPTPAAAPPAIASIQSIDPDIWRVLEDFDLPAPDALSHTPTPEQEIGARVAADRYLFALRGVGRQVDAAKAEHKEYVAHLKLVHERRLAPLERTTQWLTAQLKDLFRFMPRKGKVKSVKLLGGTLGERAQADRFSVMDDERAFAIVRDAIAAGHLPEGCIVDRPAISAKDLNAALLALLAEKKLHIDAPVTDVATGATTRAVTLVIAGAEAIELAGLSFFPETNNFYAKAGAEDAEA